MNWKRGLCVAIMLALSIWTSVGILSEALAQGETAVPSETQGESNSPRSPDISEAPAEKTADLTLVRMMIHADELSVGGQIEIMTPNRRLLQRLTVDEQHEAVTQALPPGQYLAVSEQLGSVLFSLHENASVAVIGGNGWSDGEMLCMSARQTGTVRICRTVDQAAVDALDGFWCVYSLIGTEYASDRVLHFTVETEQKDGKYRLSCMFGGLAEGTYTLLEDGAVVRQITISADAPEQELLLPEAPAG